jgi:hypothetical protein
MGLSRERVENAAPEHQAVAGIMLEQARRDAAPLITQDAVLAMLEEARDSGRWIRWTFWAVIAGLAVSLATLLVVLLG